MKQDTIPTKHVDSVDSVLLEATAAPARHQKMLVNASVFEALLLKGVLCSRLGRFYINETKAEVALKSEPDSHQAA